MMSLELPHITVLSKCDLIEDKRNLSRFLNADYKQKKVDFTDISHLAAFQAEQNRKEEPEKKKTKFEKKYELLSERIQTIVEDFSLISMLPLDIHDEETITDIIYHSDSIIQFNEAQESDEKDYLHAEARLNEASEGNDNDFYNDGQ